MMNKCSLRVLVVTPGINPASGGPTRSCKGLCRALSQANVEVSLLVLHGQHCFENPAGVKVFYQSVKQGILNQPSGCPNNSQLSVSSLPALTTFDLVHLQGLWIPGLHAVAKRCRKQGVPYIISTRGMLDPWALTVKHWKKRIALFLYQLKDLKGAAAFHATAELEASHLRKLGFTQPIIVAPNGVDAPMWLKERLDGTNPGIEDAAKIESQVIKSPPKIHTALFLSRLHPGKGLISLAEAWARVRPIGWVMRVVGPDSYGHKAELIAKLDALGITHADVPSLNQLKNHNHQSLPISDWQFVDMVDDETKWQEYVAADLLIHPSVSENFGITIAEALYAGIPVICTKGTPWSEIEGINTQATLPNSTSRAGWWIDLPASKNIWIALDNALKQAVSLSDAERMQMGREGSRLAQNKYGWQEICHKMINGYGEVLDGRT